jgi:predicted Zn-dependent protease
VQMAGLCAQAGMIQLAEARLAGASGATPAEAARQTLASARQRFGVPPGAPSRSPDEEAARARAWFAVRAALDARQLDQASAALTPALARFPGDGGLLALRCEVNVRGNELAKDSDGSCERALAVWSEMPRALFWGGLSQANRGQRPAAIRRLERARALEPEFEGPWKVLADLYRFEGRRADLATLRTEYQTRFGKPLH